MAETEFSKRMSKKAFEQKIATDFDSDLGACQHIEEGKKMTLYYVNNVHVGTWMSGRGWAFKSAYQQFGVTL